MQGIGSDYDQLECGCPLGNSQADLDVWTCDPFKARCRRPVLPDSKQIVKYRNHGGIVDLCQPEQGLSIGNSNALFEHSGE